MLLPDGSKLIPVLPADGGEPLRLCAAVAPAGHELLLLRSTADSRVWLGALVDRTGRVREWVELAVQTISGLASSLGDAQAHLSNRAFDERWRLAARAAADLDSEGFLDTGWETNPPPPVFLDVASGRAVHPGEEGQPWTLCRDDAALLAVGLPAYSSSLHRYWWSGGEAARFAPATAGAPEAPLTVRPELLLPRADLIPFSPEGGALSVRRLRAFDFAEYASFLAGRPWRGAKTARETVFLDTTYRDLGDWDRLQQGGVHLFSTRGGRCGRFVEAFHLRLLLLAQIVRQVRDTVARTKLPFLNLADDSFRIELPPPVPGLPVLWAARAALVRPPQAAVLPLRTSDARFYKALEQPSQSVFRPEFLGLPIRGEGSVRIRRVFADTSQRTCLEGTLVTHERVGHSASDLLWLQVPLVRGRVDLYAHLDTAEGLAPGEARFRTIPQDLSRESDAALRASEGNSFPKTPFETVPLLSTPADLYSLGVLATLLLCVNPKNTLGVAVDEMLSFARRLAQFPGTPADLPARAHRIAQSDRRWIDSLGAHRLSEAPMLPDEAFAYLPAEVWWGTLGTITRFFPGIGADSHCRDFGDAPPFNPERVFHGPLSDLENLLVRSRGLLFGDWTANREIAAVLARLR